MALAFKRNQAEIDALVKKEEAAIEKLFNKKVAVVVDYDGIKNNFPGDCNSTVTKVESIMKGIKSWILKGSEGSGLNNVLKSGVGKDALGKEAFNAAFDTIKLSFVAGAEEKEDVNVEGKTLHFQYTSKADNPNAAGSSNWCNSNIGSKKVERLLPELGFKRGQADVEVIVKKEEAILEKFLGKKFTVTIDYDSIKNGFKGNVGKTEVTQSDSIMKGIKSWILKGSDSSGVSGLLKNGVAKDAMGKEVFNDTFEAIRITFVLGTSESAAVSVEGKTLVLKFTSKADNEYAAGTSAWCSGDLAKAIEKLF